MVVGQGSCCLVFTVSTLSRMDYNNDSPSFKAIPFLVKAAFTPQSLSHEWPICTTPLLQLHALVSMYPLSHLLRLIVRVWTELSGEFTIVKRFPTILESSIGASLSTGFRWGKTAFVDVLIPDFCSWSQWVYRHPTTYSPSTRARFLGCRLVAQTCEASLVDDHLNPF